LPASGAGTESVEDIIALSHNVGAAEIGMSIGRTLYRTIRAFGFGARPSRTGRRKSRHRRAAGGVERFAARHDLVRQGISTTSLALIRAYAAIANGGLLMRPRIVHALGDPDGT